MIAYSLRDLTLYFLKLGSLGWGGPVALVGSMRRDLVDTRNWISEDDFKEGLALSQLAPGPLAAQLAIYLGYVHFRVWGATIVGIAFVLPSFIMVVALGMAYVSYGGILWMQAVFYGVGSSVIGIIAVSSYRLTTKTVGTDPRLIVIFLIGAISTYIAEQELIAVILLSGVAYMLMRAPSNTISSLHVFLPVILQFPRLNADNILMKIALYFATAGTFVFGSGLAIVPFLYGGVVKDFGWLNEQQFLDAVAVAMITPGPVVITVGFIGYLVAGFPGACVAALATFVPCYLITIISAPYFKRFGKHAGVKAFVEGLTAATIGAIVGAVLVLGKRTITDLPSTLIACSTAALLVAPIKLREPYLIAGAAIAGLILRSLP